MGQILVRNLDDSIIERLKAKAKREHVSLEQSLRGILTEAAKPSRQEIIVKIDAIARRIGPVEGDSTQLIREDRDNEEPYR